MVQVSIEHNSINGSANNIRNGKTKRTTPPHFRMTFELAVSAYKQGLITAAGLVYYAVKTSRRDGHKLRIYDVGEFCRSIGINQRTYYKAVTRLKNEGLLDFSAVEGMDLWVPAQSHEKELASEAANSSVKPNGQSDCPNGQNQRLKPVLDKGSGNSSIISSDLYQYSLSLYSIEKEEEGEREKEKMEKNPEIVEANFSATLDDRTKPPEKAIAQNQDPSSAAPPEPKNVNFTHSEAKPLLPPPRSPVQAQGKPQLHPNSKFYSQEEMDDFYKPLIELGRSKGIGQPSAWAIVIIKGINSDGLPCEYLDEFRAGLPLGSSEQKEWEFEPGKPYPAFLTYLGTRLKENGMSEEQAIQKAHVVLRNQNQTADLWAAFKRTTVRLGEQWERDQRLGVSGAYIPPELLPRENPPVEQAVQAMQQLQANSVQAIAPASTPPAPAIAPTPTPSLPPTPPPAIPTRPNSPARLPVPAAPVPLAPKPKVAEFKIGDLVAHADAYMAAYAYHGEVERVEDECILVRWRERAGTAHECEMYQRGELRRLISSATVMAVTAPIPSVNSGAIPIPEGDGSEIDANSYRLVSAADFGTVSAPPPDFQEQIKKQMAAMVEKTSMRKRRQTAEFLTERPDLEEAQRLFNDSVLRAELKKAIARNPEWGYEYNANAIWEIEF